MQNVIFFEGVCPLLSPVVVTTAAAFVAVVFSIVVIQIDNLGFIAVLGDGQTVVAVTVAVHIKGVAAAVGGTDFAAVPTNGSARKRRSQS